MYSCTSLQDTKSRIRNTAEAKSIPTVKFDWQYPGERKRREKEEKRKDKKKKEEKRKLYRLVLAAYTGGILSGMRIL